MIWAACVSTCCTAAITVAAAPASEPALDRLGIVGRLVVLIEVLDAEVNPGDARLAEGVVVRILGPVFLLSRSVVTEGRTTGGCATFSSIGLR